MSRFKDSKQQHIRTWFLMCPPEQQTIFRKQSIRGECLQQDLLELGVDTPSFYLPALHYDVCINTRAGIRNRYVHDYKAGDYD